MFKIRRKWDGLFSTGGAYPRFTKTGKVWRTLAQLKAHLGLPGNRDQLVRRYGDGYEIVEYQAVEVQPATRRSAMEDRPLIVKTSVLNKLRKRVFLAWAFAVMAVAVMGTLLVGLHRRNIQDVQALRAEMVQIQAEQRQVTENFVKAWENQQQTAALLVTWGSYVKERTESARFNLARAGR